MTVYLIGLLNNRMIYINCHESKEMVRLLSERADVKIENFSPGDYIINDIAVERKTLDDFFNSLVSGRLFKQLLLLKHYYSKPLLLFENFDMFFVKKRNVFYSVLIKILFELNIKILFSQCIEHSAEIILLLDKLNSRKGISRAASLYNNFRGRKSIEKERLGILGSVYNIGAKRAKALLAEFKTVKNIINAEEEKILRVNGIGKDIVERLKGV